ncbi:MAG: right-handed parallel beta-helix repeat-containing protein, partial [Planctomycetota bacterium]
MKAARMLGIVGVAVGVVLAGLAGQARGTTWYVDANGGADFNSIQAALDDPCTVDGDEIEVAPGTYYEAINFSGKAVRLYSSGGPNDTTIDGTGNYHVVKCVSGEDANTILEGFTITGGNANGTGAEQYGGGMYNYVDSSPTVTNCTFIGNSAVYGAGMYCDLSSPTVTNCIFSDNTAANYGGGMYNYDNSNPNVTNCIFSDNTAANDGGGMYNYLSSGPTVTNCIFSGNSATDRGGGMYNYDNSNPNVTNCIFTDNTAANYGGGMSNGQNSNTMVTNCIFHGNEATTNGGGMYNYDNSNPILTNCILWGNVNGQIAGNWGTVNYSCLQGSLPPSGTGNIDADPLFVDAGGGNLRVKVGSPCVDAGDNNSVPAGVTTDLDGNPRVVDGDWNGTDIVDMGAYELPPPHIHNITQNTWYGTIQGAIDDANDDDEIEVGPGTYYGAIDFLGKAVRLYSNGGPKVTTIDVSGLNWSVVTCNSGEGPNTILEGFTITGGKGKTVGGYKFGGGMYNLNSSPTVKDCNITTNSVTGDGGGMYNDNSSPTVTNCSFAGNSSVYAGGGMHNRNNSNPSVTNCTFMGNAAGGDFGGGGMLNYSSNATVTN